jgi:hypothetical protein
MTNGIKNKIVTSVYSLNYINERGSAVYKAFDLLTKTIRNILFDEYEYHKFSESNGVEKFLREFNIEYNLKSTNWVAPTAYMIKKTF